MRLAALMTLQGQAMNDDKEVLFAVAAEAVSQLFSAANAEMTKIEANLWMCEIERLGPGATLSFVEYWMSGGGQDSFRRPPKIEDLLSRVDPHHVGSSGALEALRQEIQQYGPYVNPPIENKKLRATVLALGGWAKVCQDMPDASEDFASRRFSERFRAAWAQSEALAVQKRLSPTPLLGLVDAPRQLLPAVVIEEALPGPKNY